MQNQNKPTFGEIEMIDLIAIIFKKRWFIIIFNLIIISLFLLFTFVSIILPPEKSLSPNQFYCQTKILIKDYYSYNSSVSSLLSFSGLEHIESANISNDQFLNEEIKHYISSNVFLDKIIKDKNLIEKWGIKNYIQTNSRNKLKGKLKTNFNDKTKVLTINYTDTDPTFAYEIIEHCIKLLNDYFKTKKLEKTNVLEKSILSQIERTKNNILELEDKLKTNASKISQNHIAEYLETNELARELSIQENFYKQLKYLQEYLQMQFYIEDNVIKVLEQPEYPEIRKGPNRKNQLVIVIVVSIVFSLIFTFIINSIETIINTPETIAKFRNDNKKK